jgi:hypothetical protein
MIKKFFILLFLNQNLKDYKTVKLLLEYTRTTSIQKRKKKKYKEIIFKLTS